jgi:uncharacterized protein YdaU (DUF1376 family)
MHFYKFHIGDYMSHTRHLSLLEDLAYRRLLDFYFLHEQPIKHRDAARQIGMREHEEDVLTVLNEFFLSTDNGFVNPRANKEIEEYKAHQGTSAYGAFIRDNQSLKSVVQKDVYIQHFTNGTLETYIKTLRTQDVPIMSTSSIHDATTNHKPLTTNHKPKRESATSVAPPIGVSDSVWQEFKSLRKAKKAPITQRAIDAITSEANKAGWTLEKALEECVVRGWQAFKADWVATKANPADNIRITVPASNEPNVVLEKIKADAKNAAPMPDFVRQFVKQVKGNV